MDILTVGSHVFDPSQSVEEAATVLHLLEASLHPDTPRVARVHLWVWRQTLVLQMTVDN